MKLVIDGKGKIGYLTGEVTKPAERDPKFKPWRSENSMIIAGLINSMENHLCFFQLPKMYGMQFEKHARIWKTRLRYLN